MEFRANYNTPSPKFIASRIFLNTGTSLRDDEKTIATLTRLYSIPEIKPLFDLAKLGGMGRHRLGGHSSIIQDGYDSDDEEAITEDQKFRINIDPKSASLENLIAGEDKNNHGMYWATPATKHAIYAGGMRDSNEAIGTVIHEICHFAIEEMKFNIDKPKLRKILNVMKRKEDLDPLFKAIFGYSADAQPEELIVRTAQFITLNRNGLEILEKNEPELLTYFRDIFIESTIKHVEYLQRKAFRGWSPQVFKPSNNENFSLIDSEPTPGGSPGFGGFDFWEMKIIFGNIFGNSSLGTLHAESSGLAFDRSAQMPKMNEIKCTAENTHGLRVL